MESQSAFYKRRNYEPLETEEGDEQYEIRCTPKHEAPWKPVALAVVLLLIGISFIVLGTLHATGHFFSKAGATWGFFVLGFLTFLPGFYHSRIAYYAWRGCKGYSLSSIPSM